MLRADTPMAAAMPCRYAYAMFHDTPPLPMLLRASAATATMLMLLPPRRCCCCRYERCRRQLLLDRLRDALCCATLLPPPCYDASASAEYALLMLRLLRAALIMLRLRYAAADKMRHATLRYASAAAARCRC